MIIVNEKINQNLDVSCSKISSVDWQKWALYFLLLTVVVFIYLRYTTEEQIAARQTRAILSQPNVGDLLFFDYRNLTHPEIKIPLRPNENYRVAKIIDITGNIVTLRLGDLFYQHQGAVIESVRYGQLGYKRYFQKKRYDIALADLKQMYKNKAIYLAKRPIDNKLFGGLVSPIQYKKAINPLTPGMKENTAGESYLLIPFAESNLQSAFELFQQSANLSYAKGQVNLAKMYINGYYVEEDLHQALYWLKQASLNRFIPAIYKYKIICQQVSGCNIDDFYQELTENGIDIKLRKTDFKLK